MPPGRPGGNIHRGLDPRERAPDRVMPSASTLVNLLRGVQFIFGEPVASERLEEIVPAIVIQRGDRIECRLGTPDQLVDANIHQKLREEEGGPDLPAAKAYLVVTDTGATLYPRVEDLEGDAIATLERIRQRFVDKVRVSVGGFTSPSEGTFDLATILETMPAFLLGLHNKHLIFQDAERATKEHFEALTK